MFDEQVRLRPDRPAIVHAEDGTTLSYAETDTLARGFASVLAGAGVTEGSVVAVVLGASVHLPVVYLAILRLRAVFVPLDPAWPPTVLAGRLDALDPRAVVRPPALDVGPAHEHRAINFDGRAPNDRTADFPAPLAGDLVYGIFTSGTTGGRPKCAMNYHRGLSNRFRFMTRTFTAAEEQIVLLTSGATYDTSVWQALWPLTVGASVVIPTAREMADLEKVFEQVRTRKVTFVDFVPTMLKALTGLAAGDPRRAGDLATLRHVIVGGETVHPESVQQLRRILPRARFFSAYGPAETSIGVVFHQIGDADVDRVPLGEAIDNCFAVVVDETLTERPAGRIGQIVLGGLCVGAGYLRDDQLTGRAFVGNPLPDRPGDTVYLTGDLGFVDAAGRLHFAGRMDHQIKVNGVRVEPGEIEQIAEAYPGVRSAVVLPFAGSAAASLALFVAAPSGVAAPGLRRHLASHLPRHLMPAHCVVLDRLPLSTHGKIDRHRLGAILEARRRAAGHEDRSLRGRIMSVVVPFLDGRRPAADENFLDAGGDSLRAVAIVYALSRVFDIPLSVADLLDSPSLEALEALIADRSRPGSAAPASRPDDEVLIARMETDARPAPAPIGGWTWPSPFRRHVLLTGATGYLGSRLASALLDEDDVTVTCLVRASFEDDDAATDRVRSVLARLGLWREQFDGRLSALASDLAQPGLGLAADVWDRLSVRADVVVHAGARVNFLDDYAAHRPHNVAGTAEILRLASAGGAKPLYHVSTLAVLNRVPPGPGTIAEDVGLDLVPRPRGGYAQSKWVAERLLSQARDAGAPVTVLRLGEVMPASDNGEPNPRSLTHLILSTMRHLGIAPTTALRSDYSPVSYVADRIVRVMRDETLVGRTVHIFHPESVDYATIPRVNGGPVARVPDFEFVAAVRSLTFAGPHTDAAVLAALLSERAGAAGIPAEQVLSGLLSDNPRLFGRQTCHIIDEGGSPSSEPLDPHIAACRRRLG
jgi:amino acid adenylation domain-containing protein/thioester reductase-like protein